VHGRKDGQRELLDVESFSGHLLAEGSVFSFLAQHRSRLFPEEAPWRLADCGRRLGPFLTRRAEDKMTPRIEDMLRRPLEPTLEAARRQSVEALTSSAAARWPARPTGSHADEMLQVLADDPGLANPFGGFAPRPDSRPATKFERRGLDLGHRVRDVIVRRVR